MSEAPASLWGHRQKWIISISPTSSLASLSGVWATRLYTGFKSLLETELGVETIVSAIMGLGLNTHFAQLPPALTTDNADISPMVTSLSMVFVSNVWAEAKLVRNKWHRVIIRLRIFVRGGESYDGFFCVWEKRHIKTIILSVNVSDMKCKLPETQMYTKTQNRLGLRELSNAVRAAEGPWVSENIGLSYQGQKKEVGCDNWWCLRCPAPTSPATRTRPPWPGWPTGSSVSPTWRSLNQKSSLNW